MKTQYIFGALVSCALFSVGCENAFQFEEVKVACEPPAASARYGKNPGPVITSPEIGTPFNGTMTVRGTCVADLTVDVRGKGLLSPVEASCSGGEFSAVVTFTEGDGVKEIDVAQKSHKKGEIIDRACFAQDTTPPRVKIEESPSQRTFNTKTVRVAGTCESGLDVEISGPLVNEAVLTNCKSGRFETNVTFIGEDGLKNIIAKQIDRAGNKGDDDEDYLTDTVAPLVQIESPTDLELTNGNITVTGTCETGIPVIIQGETNNNAVQSLACKDGRFETPLALSNGDGIKNISVTQTDVAGNSGADTVQVAKDTTPPKIEITSPAENTRANKPLVVSGICESPLNVRIAGSGVTETQSVVCINNAFTTTITLTAPDGEKEVLAEQTDLIGNVGRSSRQFIRDTAAPVLTIDSPAADSIWNKSLTLTGSCESNLDVSLSGAGILREVVTKCSSDKYSQTIELSEGDGVKNIIAAQTDAVGNQTQVSRNFIRDTLAPRVKITSPTNNSYVLSPMTLTGECETGLAVELSGSGLLSPPLTVCEAGVFRVSVVLAVGDGVKNIVATQTDKANNKGSDSKDYIVKTLAPEVKITSPTPNTYVSATSKISGTCESGLVVTLAGDGVAATQTTECKNSKFSSDVTWTPSDGNKQVIASQIDGAGNVGRDEKIYKRDTLSPVIAITAPATGTVAQSGLTVSGVCELGLPVVLWGPGIDNTMSATCNDVSGAGQFSSPITFSAGQGSKEIRASQTDAAGNAATDTRTFSRDNIAPIVSITSPAANSYVSSGAVIKGACESGLSVTLSGSGIANSVTTDCVSNEYTTAIDFSSGDGTKNIVATQIDLAGNTGTANRSFLRDSIAPAIRILSPDANSFVRNTFTVSGSCESGLNVELSGAGTQTPKSTACTAGTFTASLSPSSGDGNKVIVATQTDVAGNTNSDSRTFLSDTTAPVVRITSPAPGKVLDSNLTFVGTCETGLMVNLTGSGLAKATAGPCTDGQFTMAAQLSSTDGSKQVIASQIDSAGNVGRDVKMYELDGNGPSIKITGPPTGTRAATGITLTGTCKSGLIVRITGDVNTDSTTSCSGGLFSADVLFSPSVGSKKITASQTDSSNRTSSDTRNFVRANNAGYEMYTSKGPGGKVDILFVNDNSSSMEFEQTALGNRFSSFTTQLKDVDWQTGMITTDCTSGSMFNFCGQLFDFDGRPGEYILTERTPDFLNVFKSTIQREETPDCWRSSSSNPCPASNEEGLKSTIEAIRKRNTDNSGFFRSDSDLAVVYLSDENEQSTGPATATKPTDVINAFQSAWGKTKKLSAYAIVIKPGDSACLDQQRSQPAGRLSSNYGTFQDELATLTGGMTASICEPDYSVTLQRIGQDVTRLSKSYDLSFTPITGTVKVTYDGVTQPNTAYTVSGKRVTFINVAPMGVKVEIFYEH